MTSDTFTPAEFDCVECGRHIIVVSAPEPPELRLCATCLILAGWFRVPALRAVIDPDHDGHEANHGRASA